MGLSHAEAQDLLQDQLEMVKLSVPTPSSTPMIKATNPMMRIVAKQHFRSWSPRDATVNTSLCCDCSEMTRAHTPRMHAFLGPTKPRPKVTRSPRVTEINREKKNRCAAHETRPASVGPLDSRSSNRKDSPKGDIRHGQAGWPDLMDGPLMQT